MMPILGPELLYSLLLSITIYFYFLGVLEWPNDGYHARRNPIIFTTRSHKLQQYSNSQIDFVDLFKALNDFLIIKQGITKPFTFFISVISLEFAYSSWNGPNDPYYVESYVKSIHAWNISLITSPLPSSQLLLNDLLKYDIVMAFNWICVQDVHQAGQAPFLWKNMTADDSYYVNCTTYFIRDYMAVGHALLELELMQAMKEKLVDKIFIQIAPCSPSMNDLFCPNPKKSKIGTW